jgi:hypothetical protein
VELRIETKRKKSSMDEIRVQEVWTYLLSSPTWGISVVVIGHGVEGREGKVWKCGLECRVSMKYPLNPLRGVTPHKAIVLRSIGRPHGLIATASQRSQLSHVTTT